jgi:hypothetical protein
LQALDFSRVNLACDLRSESGPLLSRDFETGITRNGRVKGAVENTLRLIRRSNSTARNLAVDRNVAAKKPQLICRSAAGASGRWNCG